MLEILLVIILSTLLLFLVKKYSSIDVAYFSGIPKPTIPQLALHIFKNRPHFDAARILHSLTKTFGETFLIHLRPFPPIIVTSNPKYFGQILSSKEHLERTFMTKLVTNILGECIFTGDVETWKHDRKVLNEAFGNESHKEYLGRLEAMLDQLDDVIMDSLNAPIDMQDILHKFILHTTMESLKDPCVSWDPKRTNEYNRATTQYLNQCMKRMVPLVLKLDVFFKMTSSYKTIQESVKIIRKFGSDFVDAHLAAKDRQTDTNNIIYRMYEAGVPYERIVDNVLMFILAAHETVATTLSYAIFELAKQPDVQSRIFTEIQEQVGKGQAIPISAVDVRHLKYTQSVVRETTRKYPGAPFIARKLNRPIDINDAMHPKGTNVVFFIEGLHKSEKYHKEPLSFHPDRFSAENKANMVANSWAPFSLGIRNCIGQSLAIPKMTLILAKMVRRYNFSPVVPEHHLDIKSSLVTRSSNGIPVLITVRPEMSNN